jgi:hypothetical protein
MGLRRVMLLSRMMIQCSFYFNHIDTTNDKLLQFNYNTERAKSSQEVTKTVSGLFKSLRIRFSINYSPLQGNPVSSNSE